MAPNQEICGVTASFHRQPPETVGQALQVFVPVWNAMTPSEQQRVLKLLVQRVDYDGNTGQVDITFYPRGGESQAENCSEGEGEE